MASTNTLFKKILNVKNTVVTKVNFFKDRDGVNHIQINARPNKWHEDECPVCHKRCPRYDCQCDHPRTWRGLDLGSTLVEIVGFTHRIQCPEHGVLVADVPWAYPGSGFTKEFDLVASWLATCLSRSAVSEFMRIDWETVGRCVHRTLNEIEPERSRRLNGLVNIGIDETSYRHGHKYITVIINNDNNSVVWMSPGHGKAVLTKFFEQLTPDQLSSIRTVTGDGARWITECVNQYTPECERCVDSFHVVEWAMDALDEVRREAWRKAYEEAERLAKEHPQGRGRPKAGNKDAAAISAARSKAEAIKNSAYALGKAPEHLTENQQIRIEMIARNDDRLYRAYRMKESLRLLLKLHDPEEAEEELNRWLWWASHSRIPAFHDLYLKIRRHKEYILNTIRLGMSNARIEAVNNKIKLIIRKAYGFRNIENMMDMVYLVCSDLSIPLPNRKPKSAQAA